ncbi:MAG: chloride channel protein [Armatimonadota bacterium]
MHIIPITNLTGLYVSQTPEGFHPAKYHPESKFFMKLNQQSNGEEIQSSHSESPYSITEKIRDYFQISQTTGLIALALLVGAGSGLGAVLYVHMIEWSKRLFMGGSHSLMPAVGPLWIVISTTLGGAVCGLLVHYFAAGKGGDGLPEIMAAVAENGGKIRARFAVTKIVTSAITIGSGGSAGREGPMAQIGACLGSSIGQILRLDDDKIRLLVACGSAGAIASAFNAPIGGALFALEIILRTFNTRSFGAVVLATVASATVSHAFLGNSPAFIAPKYSLKSAWELLLYVLMGVLCAFAAVLFIKMFHGAEALFKKLRIWWPIKPMIGGALVGVMGIWMPRVLAGGYDTMTWALAGKASLIVMAALIICKMIATSLTLGSGGSGGTFAPSLFIGCAMGYTFGHIVNSIFPHITAGPGAYALVAMGAFFAGAVRAPMTAILIIFEMTNDYNVMLPLMAAVVVSTIICERVCKGDIYTLKLLQRGIDLTKSRAMDRLDNITVRRAMTSDFETVDVNMPLGELIKKFADSGHHGFPVTMSDDRLWGIVTLKDIGAMSEDQINSLTVRDVATSPARTVRPDQSLHEAIKQFGIGNVGRLPVVDRSDPDKLIGILRRSDIIEAYAANLRRREKNEHSAAFSVDVESPGIMPLALTLDRNSPWRERCVADLGVSKDALIVSVERAGKAILPRGDTILEAGDKLTLVAESQAATKIREQWENWAK